MWPLVHAAQLTPLIPQLADIEPLWHAPAVSQQPRQLAALHGGFELPHELAQIAAAEKERTRANAGARIGR